ncbi:MAG: FHA domain-containing protein [Gammaproteobacteria bacterium]|nr:FHA domain-containing protein [Gammaproteobacteria bacterium]
MDAHERSQLVVKWNGQQWTVDAAADCKICLGGTDACDVQVARTFCSRDHAYIKHDQQCFVLVDRSTNGSFVQTQDEQVSFVRRAEIRLWGEGFISLGEPLSQESAIRFLHT